MAEKIIRPGSPDHVDCCRIFPLAKKFLSMPLGTYQMKVGEFTDGVPYLVVESPDGPFSTVQVYQWNA